MENAKNVYKFIYEVVYARSQATMILSGSEKGEIVIALDEANLRPIYIKFSEDYYCNRFYLLYQIKGFDDLNLLANAFKFSKENIVPCLNNALKDYVFILEDCCAKEK